MSSTALRDSLLERLGLSQAPPPQAAARLACRLYPAGLPLGQLVLIQGSGRTEAVARLLAQHPDLGAAWVEERLSAYPPGLAQRGVALERLLFVESGAQGPWALAQLLRSQAFPVLVAASAQPEAGLRRLQLAAEHSQALVLLLAPPLGGAWAMRLRLRCVGRGEQMRLVEEERS
jgi:hypothetical protein